MTILTSNPTGLPQPLMEDFENVFLAQTYLVPVDTLFNTLVGVDPAFMKDFLEDQDAYGKKH